MLLVALREERSFLCNTGQITSPKRDKCAANNVINLSGPETHWKKLFETEALSQNDIFNLRNLTFAKNVISEALEPVETRH